MLDIPEEVKELLKTDGIRKNVRIHFINGEHTDLTNSDIVEDSFSFTESLCSQSSLKFGIMEDSVLSFETYLDQNIKGAEISAFCEVDISSLSSEFQNEYGQTSKDVNFPYYQIPYGIFTIDSSKKENDMRFRNVTAYTKQDFTINEIAKAKLSFPYKTATVYTMRYDEISGISELPKYGVLYIDYNNTYKYDTWKISGERFTIDTENVNYNFVNYDDAYMIDDLYNYKYYIDITYRFIKITGNITDSDYIQDGTYWKGVQQIHTKITKERYNNFMNQLNDIIAHLNNIKGNIKNLYAYNIINTTKYNSSIKQLDELINTLANRYSCVITVTQTVKKKKITTTKNIQIKILKQIELDDEHIEIISEFVNPSFQCINDGSSSYSVTIEFRVLDDITVSALEYDDYKLDTSNGDLYINIYKNSKESAYNITSTTNALTPVGVGLSNGVYHFFNEQYIEELNIFIAYYYPAEVVNNDSVQFTFSKNIDFKDTSNLIFYIFNIGSSNSDIYMGKYYFYGTDSIKPNKIYTVEYNYSSITIPEYSGLLEDYTVTKIEDISSISIPEITDYLYTYDIYAYTYEKTNGDTSLLTGDTDLYYLPYGQFYLEQASDGYYYCNDVENAMANNIQACAEILGEFIHIDRYGNKKLVDVSNSFALYPEETLYPEENDTDLYPSDGTGEIAVLSDYSSVWFEDYECQPYGKIYVSYKNTSGNDELLKYTFDRRYDNVYIMNNNYIFKNGNWKPADIKEIMNKCFIPKLRFIRYMPANLEMLGLPYLEAGDCVQVLTDTGGVEVFMLRRTLSGEQYLTDSIEVDGDEYATYTEDSSVTSVVEVDET